MKRKLFLSFIFSLFFSFANSQNYKIGATLNLGVSKSTYGNAITPESKFTKSGNLGFYLEDISNSNFALEVLWVQMEGLIFSNFSISEPIPEINLLEKRWHINYIGLPMYYQYRNKRIGVRLGVQPLFLIHAKSNRFRYSKISGQAFRNHLIKKETSFQVFDIGPKLGVDFDLNNNLRLKTDSYFGILKKGDTQKFRSVQFTIGLISFFDL